MGLSRRQYAQYRGVSESAVRKAISTGRIVVEDDGTIDPTKADGQWDAQTDPAKQRGAHAKSQQAETAAGTARAQVGTKPVPRAAIQAVNDTLDEAGEAPAPTGEGEVSFLRARMANEVLKAQTSKVKLQKLKGELVDRNRTVSLIYDLARRERDAWLNWPPRVAANMAAELGVDAHRMEVVLEKYLRGHLSEMAEVKIDLR